jgi:predicted dehydrogenase
MSDAIRVGFCGAGGVVHNHLAAIARLDGLTATAISSRTLKSARAMARRYHLPAAYDDHRRVIASPEVDLVFIAAPNYQHAPLALAAFAAGKHVMVEKPLACTVAEARAMVTAAKHARRRLFYAEQLPLAPKSVMIAEAARAGRFGEINSVRQVERHGGPHSPWFFQKKTAGGGVLMDLGCHSIAVILDILRDRRVERIAAVTRTYWHTHGNVEDFSHVRLHFTGGVIGIAENSWCKHGAMDSITEIFGREGYVYADLCNRGSGLHVYTTKGALNRREGLPGWRFPQYDPLYENGYLAQLEAMRNTLRDGAPAPQTGEDGLRVMRIMDAAYRSAAQDGKPLRVSL